MSKVVRSVGRAVSKVVNGAVNAVKKVAKSKLGKVALTAAGIYFGGAALSGAMSSSSTAMAGLQNAWTSLSQAGSSLLQGNVTQAGSQLSAGASGGVMPSIQPLPSPSFAGLDSVGVTASQGATLPTSNTMGTIGQYKMPSIPGVPAGPSVVNPQGGSGFLSKMMDSPYTTPALIQAGSGMLSSVAQGRAQRDAQKEQERLTDEERKRYNRNVGTRLWG